MKLRLSVAALAALGISAAACAAVLGIDDGTPAVDAGPPDTSTVHDSAVVDASAPDSADAAPRTTCDVTKAFGPPTPLTALNTLSAADLQPRLTPDELTIVFASDRLGALLLDIYTATRASKVSPFGNPASLGPTVNTKFNESAPTLSTDGLTLYFASARPAIGPINHIYASTRATPMDAFSVGALVAPLNSATADLDPFVDNAGNPILVASSRSSLNAQIFAATALADGGYTTPALLTGVGDGGLYTDRMGTLSKDGLVLYFSSDRPGGAGGMDVWVTTRATPAGAFGAPKQVPELGTPGADLVGWVSDDLCRIYYSSTKVANGTDSDLYVAERAL